MHHIHRSLAHEKRSVSRWSATHWRHWDPTVADVHVAFLATLDKPCAPAFGSRQVVVATEQLSNDTRTTLTQDLGFHVIDFAQPYVPTTSPDNCM